MLLPLLLIGLVSIRSSYSRLHFAQNSPADVTHSLPLSSTVNFKWRVDRINMRIIAGVQFSGDNSSWFAIGFSDYGKLNPADYCVMWHDWHREVHFQDTWTDDDGKIHVDLQQDCENFTWKRQNNVTYFTFSRKLDTCDEHDYIIERGTTHLVWLRGRGPLVSLAGLEVSNAEASGMARAELYRMPHKKPGLPIDAWKLQLLAHQVQVPNKETTYWCRVQKLPEVLRRKHHILQFGPVIQAGNEHLVHHMEVFHCAGPVNDDVPMYDGPCDGADRPVKTQICKKVLAAWAMGADEFVYPEEAGLAIGGADFNPYVMLEVHYNNPELHQGAVDSSGIRFILTETLRKYDAGVIELGLEYIDKMAIPPQQVREVVMIGMPLINHFATMDELTCQGQAVLPGIKSLQQAAAGSGE